MLLLTDDRKVTIDTVENLKSMIEFYGVGEPLDLISHIYDYTDNTWDKVNEAIEYLSTLKFFNRFSENDLRKKIFPKLIIRKYEK
jgi:hypothetical protein